MTDRGLRVFVSSSIGELLVERDHVRRALADLDLVSFTYENDAPATMGTHQDVWREALVDSGICLAIIHRKAGIYTQDEINTARAEGIPLLVYRRLLEPGETLPADEQAFVDELDHPVSGIALRLYEDPESLAKRVRYDIPDLLAEWAKRIRKILKVERAEATGVRHTAAPTDAGLESEQAKGPGIRPLDPDDARRIGPNEGAFVGRAAQLAKLRSFLTMSDRRIALVGDGGSGRKTILRAFAHSDEAEGGFEHGSGIHPFQSPADDLEDLRQAIWEEFFVADDDDPSVVNPRRRRRDLRNRNALIVLLDLALDDAEIAELVDDMPKAKFVITRAGDAAWNGKRIEVPPLESEAEIIELFEDRYNGSVPAAARPAVLAMSASLGGIPARIELLANRAWDEATDPGDDGPDHPLIAWSAAKAAESPQDLLRWLIPGAETEIANTMAAVDAHTPREVLAEVVPLRRVDLALADGTAISASPRYALNPALTDAIDITDRDARLAEVFAASLTWVESADHDRIYQERAFVLRMLDYAERVGDHAGVIALSRATEHAFAMGARHGAWRQALEKARAAGEAAGDAEATSWALHQLGTRALLRDELDDAREFLHDALEIREKNGDYGAAELTRRNLELVPMALTSLASMVLLLLLIVGWGAALYIAEDGWGGDSAIDEATAAISTGTTSEGGDDEPPNDTGDEDDETPTDTVAPDDLALVIGSIEATPDPITADGAEVTLSVPLSADVDFTVDRLTVEIDGQPLDLLEEPTCLGAGPSAEVSCVVTVAVIAEPGSVDLNVSVAATGADGQDGDDSDVVTVAVELPPFEFGLSDLTGPPVREDEDFQLTVTVDGGGDPFTVTAAEVTVDDAAATIIDIDCLDREIESTTACRIVVAAALTAPEASVEVEVELTAARSTDGETGVARAKTPVAVERVVALRGLEIESSTTRVVGDELRFDLVVKNPGPDVATGVVVTGDRGETAQCESSTMPADSTQLCTMTVRPDDAELNARQVVRPLSFDSTETREQTPTAIFARFSTVVASVVADGTTSGVNDATITVGGRTRSVAPSGTTIFLAEPGSASIQIAVPPTSTLTAVSCGGGIAGSGTPAGATFEQSVTVGTDAAVDCSFTLLGHPVIDIDTEIVTLAGTNVTGTIRLTNVGTNDATGFGLNLPAGFSLVSPCATTLAAGQTCTVDVRYDVNPPVDTQAVLDVFYDGEPRGDSRIRLSYQS